MDEDAGFRFVARAGRSAYRCAEVAESLVLTFERLAATYRWMATGNRSPEAAQRLLGHAARLQSRAEHEVFEAARLRQIMNAHG